MKTFLLSLLASIFFLFTISSTIAQTSEIWGLTSQGGKYNTGVIFKTDGDGNHFETVYHLHEHNDGEGPFYTDLCEAANGQLYGMNRLGGAHNRGVVFYYNLNTNDYVKVFDFDSINGDEIWHNNLTLAANGKLYGTAPAGGTNNKGTLFEIDTTTNNFNKENRF